MKQSITASIMLLLAIIIITGAQAEPVPARVIIGTREAFASPSAIFESGKVLGAVDLLRSLGATHGAEKDGKISVTSALGHTSEIETVNVKGNTMLPMNKVAEAIGVDYSWNASNRTLTLTARLKSVEFYDGNLKVNCTIPVSYKLITSNAAGKLIIDVNSAKIATPANEVYVGTPLVTRARIGQYDSTTARVVLDLEKNVSYKVNSAPLDAKIDISVTEKASSPSAIRQSAASQKKFTVTDIKVEEIDDLRFQVVMTTSDRGAVIAGQTVKPSKVYIKLPNAVLADTAISHSGSHKLLTDLAVIRDSAGEPARLELALNRTMITETSVDDNSITVMVKPPNRSGGSISDKVIVIDPGHGGSQPGARSSNVLEKDLNLAIGREVASLLQNMGAKVIFTRAGDQAVGLSERPEVAVNNNADAFISIHCNSNGTKNSATGIETYYHMSETSSKILAESVHKKVVGNTGMYDRKARSDSSLYSSGLAVLRKLNGSGIPGLLLECGYINNASDCSKLCNVNYRKKVAEGIVEGLREYIEGN